jgi:maleylpyruvate isomerase
MIELYGYFRSSAAYRVRIALNLKSVSYEYLLVHLVKGEQSDERYRALNPQALVPTLVDDGQRFTQSIAIIEYLDEKVPDPPLLPATPEARARVRAIAQAIACDIHPLNNLRVLKYLTSTLGVSEDAARNAWYRHWTARLGRRDRACGGHPHRRFCHGETPTLRTSAIPQLATRAVTLFPSRTT